MILAIETSTEHASLALHSGGATVERRAFTSERAHNSLIFAPLRELLEAAGPALRLVVAGTGPGSYTGVRIGISAALGISVARSIPLIGLPSVTALPAAGDLPAFSVCGDARRGSWWCAEVRGAGIIGEPLVDDPDKIAARLAELNCPVFTTDRASPPFCQAVPDSPDAALLAARADALTDAEVRELSVQTVEPVYLRPPFITMSTRWKVAGGPPS